ncbi:hypothetical protein PHJA_000055600 [Phtheirospermum japonicum]|uniref:Uncharacterized protein n=1 Tax=Phtheirospermum japonicum TaxID=374723 RepID=A0A830BAP8_9LAMI|nr:hypothetical protein PHJA_000055600 [Phtheirospermum japonicum]
MKTYEKPREAHEVPKLFSKLELTASLTSVSKAVDNWLLECHGRSIVLISPSSELIKLTRAMIMERRRSELLQFVFKQMLATLHSRC